MMRINLIKSRGGKGMHKMTPARKIALRKAQEASAIARKQLIGGSGEKLTYKTAQLKFIQHAQKRGYKHKVVGDDSYTKSRKPGSKFIKLIGAKGGKVQISENGKRYEI